MARFSASSLCLSLLLLLLTPVAASAQSNEFIEQSLAAAYEDYDMLDLQAAASGLETSIALIEVEGIASPAAAETYVMYGIVLFAITGDAGATADPFERALLIDPDVQINPYYATPTLTGLLEDARNLVTGGTVTTTTTTPPPVTTTPEPPPVTTPPVEQRPAVAAPTLSHRAVREAPAGQVITLGVSVPATLPVTQVRVQFRPVGAPQFYSSPMLPSGDTFNFVGQIPAEASASSIQIDYYIEAIDARGYVLESIGSANQPIPIIIRRATSEPVDDYLAGPDPREDAPEHIGHVAIGVGTGVGLATADPNAYGDIVELNPGLALSPLQFGLHLGFSVSPTVEIIPFARFQLVFLDTGAQIEPMGGLKARYYAVNNPRARFYIEGGAGYGEVSHLVYLAEQETYDTTNEGPVHVGAGLGGVLLVTDNFGFNPGIYLMTLFPEFSVHVDATVSLYFEF
jgi:hypothetical protein